MKKTLSILLFISFVVKGQVNLVLNPSFEDTISHCLQKFTSNCCPGGADRIMMSRYWSGPDTVQHAWNPPYSIKPNGACCVPQFFSSCGTSALNVPGTYQPAKTGQAYSGLATYMATTLTWTTGQTMVSRREYLKGRLSTPFVGGKEYCGTFYFNLYNYSLYAADKIGMFISNTPTLDTAKCYNPMIFFSPQVQYNGGIVLDTLNWIKVESTFIANGGENYIVIGNFNSDANTNKVLTNFPNPNAQGALYLVDDVSIIRTDLLADAGTDKNILLGDSTFIGKPPEIGLNCIWTTGTSTLGSGAGIWVKPAVTTNYVIHQTICGITKTDTVTVTVDYVGIKENSSSTPKFIINPNPNSGSFYLQLLNRNKNAEYDIKIKDITGKLIYNTVSFDTQEKNTEIILEVEKGLYFISLYEDQHQVFVQKIIIEK